MGNSGTININAENIHKVNEWDFMREIKHRISWRTSLIVFLAIILLLTGFLVVRDLVRPAVTFVDSRLELAVREHLDIREGPISQQDAQSIIELDAYGMGIQRLEGIENLTALEGLNLHDNFIEDLSPLAGLTQLRSLNLRNNEIYDLELVNFHRITHLPLVELSLRHNVFDLEDGTRIRIADISLLGELTELEVLELRDNHIADLSPLASLENLRVLDLCENRIADIDALGALTGLRELNLRENQVTDLSSLQDLTGLVYLNIHTNPIDDGWETLANFSSLETLIMRNVEIADHAWVLSSLVNLRRLNMRNTAVEDLSFLANLSDLVILDLRDNHIVDILPLAQASGLEELDLRKNGILDVTPLGELTSLRSLNLRDNAVADLAPLGSLSELRYLNIHSNPIEDGLPVLENLVHLERLIMRNVRIGGEYHFLAGLSNLQGLNIQNTAIDSLEPLGDLMAGGALQDDVESAIFAYVNILENNPTADGEDTYAPIRPYWENITYRYPLELP